MESGFAPYYVDHTVGVWPQAAGDVPFSATQFQVTGDPITDLTEDMAAEQKARTTYDNLLRVIKDPEVCDPIRFLREREIVHFQRFGETNRKDCNRQEHTKFQLFFCLYFIPHSTIASKIGFRLYPVSVKVYSTRGGTSGYTFRVSKPLASIERKFAVKTF